MSVNKCILIGRLGKDPETKFSASGAEICSFSIATSEKVKGEEKTEWHNLVAFGKTAEICGKYLAKGSQVYVEGRLSTSSWETKTGEKRYRTEIIVSNVQFLGGKMEQETYQEQPTDVKKYVDFDKQPAYDDSDEDSIPF